jgi:hypothetical protein
MSIAAHVASAYRVAERPPFWRRQFQGEPTPAQRVYDVVFGVVAPFACFALEPLVVHRFGHGSLGGSLLGRFALPVYGLAAVAAAAIGAWHLLRRSVALWVVGPLFAGALGAFGLGVLLAPLALVGLFVAFVGVLGLVPFLSAFAYLRNAVRALRACRAQTSPFVAASALWLGMGAAVALPLGASFVAHRVFHRAFAAVQSEDERTRGRGMETLRRWAWLMEDGWYRRAYNRASGAGRQRIEDAYRDVRGEELLRAFD